MIPNGRQGQKYLEGNISLAHFSDYESTSMTRKYPEKTFKFVVVLGTHSSCPLKDFSKLLGKERYEH